MDPLSQCTNLNDFNKLINKIEEGNVIVDATHGRKFTIPDSAKSEYTMSAIVRQFDICFNNDYNHIGPKDSVHPLAEQTDKAREKIRVLDEISNKKINELNIFSKLIVTIRKFAGNFIEKFGGFDKEEVLTRIERRAAPILENIQKAKADREEKAKRAENTKNQLLSDKKFLQRLNFVFGDDSFKNRLKEASPESVINFDHMLQIINDHLGKTGAIDWKQTDDRMKDELFNIMVSIPAEFGKPVNQGGNYTATMSMDFLKLEPLRQKGGKKTNKLIGVSPVIFEIKTTGDWWSEKLDSLVTAGAKLKCAPKNHYQTLAALAARQVRREHSGWNCIDSTLKDLTREERFAKRLESIVGEEQAKINELNANRRWF